MPNTIRSKEYREVIEKLKIARIECGLTQKQVSQKLKRSQSFISKVEAGEQRVDILELKKFAEVYKKKIPYFLK